MRTAELDYSEVPPAYPCLGCHFLLVWPSRVLDGHLLNAEQS
jgi:hypothetical protein